MYFSPTDEEVETKLGLKLGSWLATPEPIVMPSFVKAAKPENAFLSFLLVLGLFVGAAALACSVGFLFKSTIAGSISFLITGFGALLILGKIGKIAHARATLGIFERGLRLGSSMFRFDELSAITLGGPDSFEEKYFPTLKKYSEAAAKIKVGSAKIEQAQDLEELKKATTLTFHLKSGKIKTWPAFGTYFEPEVTREFITLLDQTAPDDMNFQVDSHCRQKDNQTDRAYGCDEHRAGV